MYFHTSMHPISLLTVNLKVFLFLFCGGLKLLEILSSARVQKGSILTRLTSTLSAVTSSVGALLIVSMPEC